jgi:acetylornithine deacetylase/succinyl-diaminopimelate desuccinylase-like protein
MKPTLVERKYVTAYEYAARRQEQFLDELKELLRIPSVSALPEHRPDINRAAEWLAGHLRRIGMPAARVIPTEGNPLVFAEWNGSPGAPTVLVYGHYDVQPVDDARAPEKWRTSPFEPTIQNGSLYCRGASDNKGQLFCHLKAVEALLQTEGRLPVNLKIILEGEEEISSGSLTRFIPENAESLKADVCVVSDSSILAMNRPSICCSLRGMVYTEIEIHGPRTDLHSGIYGGVAHNPAQALCEILAALHDDQGRVNVPGFYDGVQELTVREQEMLAQVPWSAEDFTRETGAPAPWGEAGYSLRERVGARPTLEVNGIVGGFIGDGPKTVLPAMALAKVSCRLVADQDPAQVFRCLQDRVRALTPATVTSEVRLLSTALPAVIDIDSPVMDAAIRAYERGFGARPVFTRDGGSIPVVATIQHTLHIPVLMVGFGLPDDNLHAPNEKIALESFYRGIDTTIALYDAIGAGRRD